VLDPAKIILPVVIASVMWLGAAVFGAPALDLLVNGVDASGKVVGFAPGTTDACRYALVRYEDEHGVQYQHEDTACRDDDESSLGEVVSVTYVPGRPQHASLSPTRDAAIALALAAAGIVAIVWGSIGWLRSRP
jgi:hypothetical protein